MEWNGPAPAALIGESLEERGALLRRTWCVNLCVLPVRPVSLVLQSLVELAVFQVLGRDDAVAPAGVDNIVEPDGATSAICLAAPRHQLGPPRVGNLRVGREVVDRLKFDRVDLNTLIRACSRFLSVVEHQLVRLGPDHIPGVAVRAVGRQKVCVAGALTVQLERRAILLLFIRSTAHVKSPHPKSTNLPVKPVRVKRLLQVDEAQEMADRCQHRLTHMISREMVELEHHDVDALARQRRRRVGPGRTAADDKHLARLGNRHDCERKFGDLQRLKMDRGQSRSKCYMFGAVKPSHL